MGMYLDFENYSLEAIKRQPQRFKTTIKDKKYTFEISYNRMTEGLDLGIYDELGETLYSRLAITANINLASTISSTYWPKELVIWGQWIKDTTKPIAEAFMREFKIYIGGF